LKYKAILFDLDDTLLDSMAARVKSMEHVFASAGITHLQAERFLRDLHGTPLEDALVKLAQELGIQTGLFEKYRRFYWSKEKGLLRLYPGVSGMLEGLRQQKLKLGLVTTKTMNLEIEGRAGGAVTELEEMSIGHIFSVKVGFEDVTRRKPHPEAVNLALSRLGLEAGEAVMVGDSASDIKAAQAAGCHSCYATWGIPAHERGSLLSHATPDFIVDSPDELLGIVK
jgi:pyrophosphatase PpaX